MPIVNSFDYEQLAQVSLAPEIWDYFHGVSGDEVTLRENSSAFERIKLLPHVLRDVRSVEIRTTVQEAAISFPVIIAPTAFHGLVHPEGKCAPAQAAGNCGTIMVVSHLRRGALRKLQ